ncbi:MAG: carbohydrate ABC transporter permease [Actinomycetota bacterium]|nr:carbohydrate ABC transporter permease [Actinomycetota bacterium]
MSALATPGRRRSVSSYLKRRLPGHILDAVLALLGLAMVLPLIWLIMTSLTPAIEAFELPPNWLPWPITLDNFAAIPELIPFGRMALNSVIISVIATVGSLLTSTLAAYAFSRLDFAGRDKVFALLLSALMVPTQLTVIPVFILMRNLGLVDSLAAIWLPLLINVFGIFFLRQYFSSIPRELDEAARIDGAGHMWILFRMIVPLSGPALSALAILVFEASWNGFFWPLIFLNSPENMTLPLGLVSLQSAQGGGPAVVVFAAITAVVLPVLIVFMLFQRAFVASVASTGLKS